jgi:hypothetical protein
MIRPVDWGSPRVAPQVKVVQFQSAVPLLNGANNPSIHPSVNPSKRKKKYKSYFYMRSP